MAAGQPVAFDRAAASDVLRQEHVPIRLGLGHGSGAGRPGDVTCRISTCASIPITRRNP